MPSLTGASYNATAHNLTLTGTGLDTVAYTDGTHAWHLEVWDGTEAIPSSLRGSNFGDDIDSGAVTIISQTPTVLVLGYDAALEGPPTGTMAVSLAYYAVAGPTLVAEYGYPHTTFPGADVTGDPWWHHYSDPITGAHMPAFPAGAVARSIGTVQLNDGVNSRWDHMDVPGTAYVQAETLFNQSGRVAIVKTDKLGLVITAYGVFQDGGGVQFEDWTQSLEAQQDVDFVVGDGMKYVGTYVSGVVGTQVACLDYGPPPVRVYRWTFKVTCTSPVRVPV